MSIRKLCLIVPLVAWLPFSFAAPAGAEDSLESKYLANIRQVTDEMTKAGEGYFSPDQKLIAYQAVPSGFPFYQIYVQPLADGEPRRISTGRGRTTCAYFTPDGKRVMFASSHLDPQVKKTEADALKQQEEDRKAGRRRRYSWDFDPFMDIFTTDLEGNSMQRLTDSPGYDAECSYSSDGKQIVFCSDRDGDPDLYIMNSDGSNVRQLTNADGYDGGPFFSPDDRWVIFRSDRKKEGFLQIHAIDVTGKHDIALTDNIGVNWAPYWHPDGQHIIWTGADHSDPKARPNYDLWLMKLNWNDDRPAPGPITRITDHAAADVLPVFSPDGKRLMWTSNRTENHSSQLWIADWKMPKSAKKKSE